MSFKCSLCPMTCCMPIKKNVHKQNSPAELAHFEWLWLVPNNHLVPSAFPLKRQRTILQCHTVTLEVMIKKIITRSCRNIRGQIFSNKPIELLLTNLQQIIIQRLHRKQFSPAKSFQSNMENSVCWQWRNASWQKKQTKRTQRQRITVLELLII